MNLKRLRNLGFTYSIEEFSAEHIDRLLDIDSIWSEFAKAEPRTNGKGRGKKK